MCRPNVAFFCFAVHLINPYLKPCNYFLFLDPSKVLNFSVLSVSKESITLIWYYPENPNGNITSYSVEYGELNSSSNTLLAIPAIHLHRDNQAYEVGELRNFQQYKFRVSDISIKHKP